MRVRPAPPPRSIQRERVDDRPAARREMELIETAQHRLGVRPHRPRVGHRSRRPVGHLVWSAPVRARRLARHQHPAAEIAGFDACHPIPRNLDRPQKPEPPQQIHPVGAQRRIRSPRGLQVSEIRRHRLHRRPSRVDQPVRQPRIGRLLQRTRQRHHQPSQIPSLLLVFDHMPDHTEQSARSTSTRANACCCSVNR